MAQETRLAPIEFSNTPTQVLMNIGETKRQDAARQQQMAFEQQKYLRQLQDEEMKRRYENMKNFNSIIQDKQWSKETRDMYLGGLIQKYSAPGMSSTQYLSDIGKDLSNLANYQRYRDDIYDKADKFISSLPQTAKDGFDANTFKNDFLKNALFKADGTQKSITDLQAESDENWLEKTFTANKDKYYNVASAYKRIPEVIKSAPESTIKVPDKDMNGRVLTSSSTEVKFKPSFERFNDKTGKVEFRQDANGYIEDDVYNSLISFDDIDALATRSAKKFISDYNNSTKEQKKALLGGKVMTPGSFVDKDNDGLPDLLEADDINLIKKGFLTDYVKKQMPQYNKETESTKVINIDGSRGNTAAANSGFIDIFREIDNAATSGLQVQEKTGGKVTKVYGASVNQMTPAAQQYLVGIANTLGKKKEVDGEKLDFTQADIVVKKENGVLGLYEYPAGNLIAPLSDIQANLKVNPTAKTKQNVINNSLNNSDSEKPTLNSIKRTDIAAKAKAAGYTPSEYEALLKERGINIIK